MRGLLFLIAILAIFIRGQGSENCTNFYYAFNNFQTQSTFSVSCPGNVTDCNVYYTPEGKGCNDAPLTLIDQVPVNTTKIVSHNFTLGGGFCSESQIGVSAIELGTGSILAQLPRATDAGKYFYMSMYSVDETADYECSFSTLSLAANVNFTIGDTEQMVKIGRFQAHHIEFDVNNTVPILMRVSSNNPIVVSCIAKTSPNRLITFQPISSDPIFSSAIDPSFMSLVLSNCSTNELITDFTNVTVSFGNEEGKTCESTLVPASNFQGYLLSSYCSVYVEPLNNETCVSMGFYNNRKSLSHVGLPESKFTTRLGNYGLSDIHLFSFSKANCFTNNSNPLKQGYFTLQWIQGDLDEKVATDPIIQINSFDKWVTCKNPVLPMAYDMNGRQPLLVAPQSEKLWDQYFEVECDTVPDKLSEAMISNAHSHLSFKSWASMSLVVSSFLLLLL